MKEKTRRDSMGIKRFLVLGLVYVVVLSGLVVTLGLGDYSLKVFDYQQTLPVVVWVVLPTFLLFLFTIMHLVFYWIKGSIATNAIKNDEAKLIQLIKHKLSGSNTDIKLKNIYMDNIAQILSKLKITNDKNKADTPNKTINSFIETINNIQNKQFENLKEFNLNETATIVAQNNLNKILSDESYALSIIKKPQNYDENDIKVAFMQVLKNNKIGNIKSSLDSIKLDNEMFFSLVEANSNETKELIFGNQQIIDIANDLKLTSYEYQKLAKIYLNKMAPEQLSSLFEKFFATDENSSEAYLFVLFELGMIDDMREILSNSKKSEYTKFKALMQLKETGNYYTYDNLFS